MLLLSVADKEFCIDNEVADKWKNHLKVLLLIVINVALDFTRKVESQMVVRHYKGFLD